MFNLSLRAFILCALLLQLPETTCADTTHTVTVRGTERDFILHVPPSYDGSPLPVVLFFHGFTQSAADVTVPFYNWNALADTEEFFVVYPDSLIFGDGKRWDINAGSSDSQDLDFVEAILGWMATNYNYRESHVFAAGYSYGGMFSYYAAVHLPERIAAFGAHSSGLWSGTWPTPVPTGTPKIKGIQIHSPGDDIVSYFIGQGLYNGLLANGHTAEFITVPVALKHAYDNSKNQDQWEFFMTHARPNRLVQYLDGSHADATALNTVVHSEPTVSGSVITQSGGPGSASDITKTTMGGTTPAGPTAGTTTGSEWLALDSDIIGTSFDHDTITFRITADVAGVRMGTLLFDFFNRVVGQAGQSHTLEYRVQTSLNGGAFVTQETDSLSATGDGTLVTVQKTEVVELSTITLANMGDTLDVRIGFRDSRASSDFVGGLQGLEVRSYIADPVAPVVSITSPGEGATFQPGTNITLTANATDLDGAITKLEFYAGTTKLGEDTTWPFETTWNSAPHGSYALTAVATDNDANTTTSRAVNVTLNAPPTVAITAPTDGASFTEGDNLTITAQADDSDGTITKFEFFYTGGATGGKLGEDDVAPYEVTWDSVPKGTYALTAVATDDDAGTTTSSTVTITVNPAPVLVEYLDGTDADTSALTTVVSLDGSVSATPLTYAGAPGQTGNITKNNFGGADTPAGPTAVSDPKSEWIALDSGIVPGSFGSQYLEVTLTATQAAVDLGDLIFDLYARVNGFNGQSHSIEYQVETNLNGAGFQLQGTNSVTAVGDGTVVTVLETQTIDLSALQLLNIGDTVVIRIGFYDGRNNGSFTAGLQGLRVTKPVPGPEDSDGNGIIGRMRMALNELDLTWSSVTGKSYSIQRSSDLKSWDDIRTGIIATPTTNLITLTPTEARHFYRVVVE